MRIFVCIDIKIYMEQQVFFALSDPTRRNIIEYLSERSANMRMVADTVGMSRQAAAKHIHALQMCGLVVLEKQGRDQVCRFQPDGLKDLRVWLQRMEQRHLDFPEQQLSDTQ
ncbi:hypothetical protein GCM10023092_13220 [Rurimicrobium arvi]|uniref:HTH arsR-type domain-containing protein n=2 Tax=Rurimicrobium arvi TaxID=2049916 RepID=A0ABP8MRG2_9BACT